MFQPLRCFCTVVLDPANKKTPGGLVLPDGFADIFITGVIRAVGTGWMNDGGYMVVPQIQPGDRVMIMKHQQHGPNGPRVMDYPVLTDDGVACILCDYTDIAGIVEHVQGE